MLILVFLSFLLFIPLFFVTVSFGWVSLSFSVMIAMIAWLSLIPFVAMYIDSKHTPE